MEPLHQAPAFRLHRVQRLLRAHLLGLLAPLELTPEQYFLLMRLGESDGVTQSALGDPTLDDRGSVSRQVASLERRGLVQREAHPDDARARAVRLTPAGEAVLQSLAPPVQRERERLFGPVDATDLAAFHRVLTHLEALLERP